MWIIPPEEIATEQVEAEMKRRVFGIIPNFYVVYEPNPEPLTTKLKFRLAFKEAADPITAVGVALLSGAQQAGDTPNYGPGAKGFGKRFGANAVDGFTDIMIGGAIRIASAPGSTLLLGNALSYPFVCKGDNGHWHRTTQAWVAS
jgi:hypothetical protein